VSNHDQQHDAVGPGDQARQAERRGAAREKEIIPVPTDRAFWKAWRDDRKAMRAAGYRVRKVNGCWRAWIERQAG
jgi:hypothetical protein